MSPALLLARAGAVALVALVAPLVGCRRTTAAPPQEVAFDAQRAWSDLERIVAFGPRPSGSEAIGELRDFLTAELAAAGLEPEVEAFREDTRLGTIEFANVYADLEGRSEDGAPPPIVVLASHFDTKRFDFPFVGANDGGSSTAVLLELARSLAAREPPAPVTYRFLFLDGEESLRPVWVDEESLFGSRHHVEALRESGELRRVRALVLLDLVGDRDLRLVRDTTSTRELVELFFDAAREAGLGRHVGGRPYQLTDDHVPFLRANVPAVDLIDFEYGPGNAYWHTREDTLDKLSRASLDAIGRIVLVALPDLEAWALAQTP